MTLTAAIIRSNEAATAAMENGDGATCAAELLTPRLLPEAKRGTKQIIEALGQAGAEAVFTAFEATATGRRGLQMLSDQNQAGGLDFADTIVRDQITSLAVASAITTDQRDKLLALGMQSTAEKHGLTAEQVTAATCQAAWEREALSNALEAKLSVVRERIASGSITTLTEVASVIGG